MLSEAGFTRTSMQDVETAQRELSEKSGEVSELKNRLDVRLRNFQGKGTQEQAEANKLAFMYSSDEHNTLTVLIDSFDDKLLVDKASPFSLWKELNEKIASLSAIIKSYSEVFDLLDKLDNNPTRSTSTASTIRKRICANQM